MTRRVSITVSDETWDVLWALAYIEEMRPQRAGTAARLLIDQACQQAMRSRPEVARAVEAGRDFRARYPVGGGSHLRLVVGDG